MPTQQAMQHIVPQPSFGSNTTQFPMQTQFGNLNIMKPLMHVVKLQNSSRNQIPSNGGPQKQESISLRHNMSSSSMPGPVVSNASTNDSNKQELSAEQFRWLPKKQKRELIKQKNDSNKQGLSAKQYKLTRKQKRELKKQKQNAKQSRLQEKHKKRKNKKVRNVGSDQLQQQQQLQQEEKQQQQQKVFNKDLEINFKCVEVSGNVVVREQGRVIDSGCQKISNEVTRLKNEEHRLLLRQTIMKQQMEQDNTRLQQIKFLLLQHNVEKNKQQIQ
eukprot:TRINITY_DN1928_c0_g1_i1.p2 TRINITY_DN1928_c0_g1~~TRINITY_DN1928_c0_g1_i1.p2  ORF type:complete len:273 (-),score=29.77 TRINITY_DN1928_c0_g1_i1:357-1175(-)